MANIAEGFEKNRSTEFGRYLDIAKGSLAEVRSHLYIAFDVGYLTRPELDELFQVIDDTGKVLAGLRRAQAPGTGYRVP